MSLEAGRPATGQQGVSLRRAAMLRAVTAVIAVSSTLSLAPKMLDAQRATATRRIATVPLLLGYPGFYHAQPVRVSGHLVANGDTAQLFTNERNLTLLLPTGVTLPEATAKAEAFEVVGTFYDVGRTDAGDGRLSGYDLRALSQRLVKKDWPGFGELPILLVESLTAPEALQASVRAIALTPDRFADQPVTVVGRFRGRNLFGDMPAGPGKSQWDFVLQSADAAVWVTGQRPRGKGFDLRLDSRVDTGRWLEVEGTVRTDGVRTWIEATNLRLGTAPDERPAEVVQVPASPPPRVVFTAPVEGELDVERDTSVRIQFSRDIAPASFKGSVTVGYVDSAAAPGVPTELLPADMTYDEAKRTLEIKFREPLQPLRTIRVILTGSIQARDGSALPAWELTFTLGA